MQAELLTYFRAEKFEAAFYFAAGLLAIALSAWLWRTASPYRGAAIPLVLVALIQLAVGGSVFARTDRQSATLSQQLAASAATYRAAELARMEKVMTGFATYKVIEIALLLAGIALSCWPGARRTLWEGVSIGLVGQASLMLLLDLIAERRARDYVAAILTLGG